MRVEMAGHRDAVSIVLEHSDSERLQAAGDKEAVHGSEASPGRALDEVNLFGVFRTRQDRCTASGVAVAVEIFRHGVHNDMRAELDGALEIRAEECVVDH